MNQIRLKQKCCMIQKYDSYVILLNISQVIGFHKQKVTNLLFLYLEVIEIAEEKDKKGRRTVNYIIHFQGKSSNSALHVHCSTYSNNKRIYKTSHSKGWNSSWDRAVQEDFVLKDSQANRKLQRDLAEQSQLQMYKQYIFFCSMYKGFKPLFFHLPKIVALIYIVKNGKNVREVVRVRML